MPGAKAGAPLGKNFGLRIQKTLEGFSVFVIEDLYVGGAENAMPSLSGPPAERAGRRIRKEFHQDLFLLKDIRWYQFSPRNALVLLEGLQPELVEGPAAFAP